MKALILAGGEGKRLRPMTNDKPKPMLEVGGKPIIEWEILWMKRYGIQDFIVSAGYMKEKLENFLGNGKKFGVNIQVSSENEPLGTGGAIKKAEEYLKDDLFIVTNGDLITNLDLSHFSTTNSNICTLSLVPLKSQYGIVDTKGGKVVNFREKPILKEFWINAGVYLMSRKIFDYMPEKGNMEANVLPLLTRKKLLNGVKFNGSYWRSIDSIKDFEEAQSDIVNKRVF